MIALRWLLIKDIILAPYQYQIIISCYVYIWKIIKRKLFKFLNCFDVFPQNEESGDRSPINQNIDKTNISNNNVFNLSLLHLYS